MLTRSRKRKNAVIHRAPMTAKRNRGIPGSPPLLLSATRRKCPSRSTLRYPFPPHSLKRGGKCCRRLRMEGLLHLQRGRQEFRPRLQRQDKTQTLVKLPSAVADRQDREGMGMRNREAGQRGETEPTPPLSISVSRARLLLTAMARGSLTLSFELRTGPPPFFSSTVGPV